MDAWPKSISASATRLFVCDTDGKHNEKSAVCLQEQRSKFVALILGVGSTCTGLGM